MLRKEEARNRRSQARTVYKHLKGTHDKGRIAEEPGEGRLSSPVLEQRWAGRLTHRLSQIERPRLSHLRDRRLHVPRDVSVPAVLKPVVDPDVSLQQIEAGRGQLLRVTASMEGGWTSAVLAPDPFWCGCSGRSHP